MKIVFMIIITTIVCCSCGNKTINKATYEGQDISGIAQIFVDKDTKNMTLNITTNEKWTLYTGPSVDSIDFSTPLAQGEGSETIQLPSPDKKYYQLVTDKGKAILSERQLPMAGGYNFRDLGGIKNKDGRFSKWGKIFRSDDLHNLTTADLDYLAGIPITSVVDFRGKNEIEAAPDKLPRSTRNSYPLSIDPGNVMSLIGLTDLNATQMDSIMMQMNTLFVTDSTFVDKYRIFFRLLQDEQEVPLLFHCSAGKDRTGMGAALILYALGVDETTIMQDYLASNIYLGNKYAKELERNPELKSVLTVKREFLQAGIDRIKQDHGSVENFLENILKVDLAKFRERYLY